jgi:hypothetical protein
MREATERAGEVAGGADAALHLEDYSAEAPYRAVWHLIEEILRRMDVVTQRAAVVAAYHALCGESLREVPDPSKGRVSVITRIGVPAEFSFTSDEGLGTFRFLSEAGPARLPMAQRIEAAVACLRALRPICGLTGTWARVEEMVRVLFPERPEALERNWHNGAMWIATRFAEREAPVVRVYANQQAGDSAYRFAKLDRLFETLDQPWNRGHLARLAQLVDGWADIAGISFDQRGPGIGGVKVYLGATTAERSTLERLFSLVDLRQQEGALRQFLRRMQVEDGPLSGPALLCSVPFPNRDVPLDSLKFDVTTPVVFQSDREAYRATDGLLHTFRLHCAGLRVCEDLFLAEDLAQSPCRRLQYVGLTLGLGKPPRLNLYLAPPAVSLPEPPARPQTGPRGVVAEVPSAAVRAARFLLSQQSPGGGWWDLTVSAGASGPWLTAVVADALRDAAPIIPNLDVTGALQAAADYLQRAEHPQGGWGYNEALPPDCDSTAHALYFLIRAGRAVEARSLQALRRFQRPDGVFLTYVEAPPGHSWGTIHHDVHGAGVRALALAAGKEDPGAQSGLAIIVRGLQQRPIWPAFWWTATSYGAFVNLSCLAALDQLALVSPEERLLLVRAAQMRTDLELALATLLPALLGGPESDRSSRLGRLVARQGEHGGWTGARSLRVVAKDCVDPWNEERAAVAGPVYHEHRALFTTALALRALALGARHDGQG